MTEGVADVSIELRDPVKGNRKNDESVETMQREIQSSFRTSEPLLEEKPVSTCRVAHRRGGNRLDLRLGASIL